MGVVHCYWYELLSAHDHFTCCCVEIFIKPLIPCYVIKWWVYGSFCTCCNASTLQKGNVIMTNSLLHEWTVEMRRNAAESQFPGALMIRSYLPETSIHIHTRTYIYALCIYIMLNIDIYLGCIPSSGNFVAWFTEHLCLGNLHLLNLTSVLCFGFEFSKHLCRGHLESNSTSVQ